MTEITAGVVDVHILRRTSSDKWETLVLRRAVGTRCTGAWEIVHGRIEQGERPEEAAVRELREETGLDAVALYNVTVQPFYLHRMSTVQLAVVFAAVVEAAPIRLAAEHDSFEWLSPEEALQRLAWPRERSTLRDALLLLAGGDAGPVEDVLRVF